MARGLLSPVGILDATQRAVALAAGPWLGVCWLAVMPLRLAQVSFLRELMLLGAEAPAYSGHLLGRAWMVWAALLPAIWGRMVWVQACRAALQSGTPVGRVALRVPPGVLLNAAYLALLSEAVLVVTVWVVLGGAVVLLMSGAPVGALLWLAVSAPAPMLFSGLAYVAALRTERPGLLRPLVEAARLAVNLKVVASLLFTYAVALLAAFVNVYMALRGVLWALSALGGADLPRWQHLFRSVPGFAVVPAEPLVALLCVAGAALAVEPFWLASLTVYAHRDRLRDSGEDLRLRFRLVTGGR